jgi:hypothetical protein
VIVFVGDRRSKLAVKKGVRWQDGRLAAKQLFDALAHAGIDKDRCAFVNWFERGGPTKIRRLASDEGAIVVGMGRKVQAALRRAKIEHLELVHPAARGAIRKKERYLAHVAEVLKT